MKYSHFNLGFALLLAALPACQKTESREEAPVVVKVASALPVSAELGTKYSAVVVPDRQVDVSFKVPGYVRQLARTGADKRVLEEGDFVEKGTILAQVDTSDYEAKVAAAKAAFREASAAQTQAKREKGRSEGLFEQGAVTRIEVDTRETQAELAGAQVARAEAAVREASLALADTSLKAPFAGTVLARVVEEGAFVGPRSPGYVLADLSKVKIRFGVSDEVASITRVGQKSTVESPSLSRRWEGAVTRVSPAADPRSRLFSVEVTVDNQELSLKPGMVLTASLDLSNGIGQGVRVPLRSVVGLPDGKGLGVFILDPSAAPARVHLLTVDVLATVGDSVLLKELPASAEVATLGAGLLHDGAKVNVLR